MTKEKYRTKEDLRNDPTRFVPICADEIFKEVFGKEEHANITAFLVSKLLNIPYSLVEGNIEFASDTMKGARVRDKKGTKDIVFKLNLDEGFKINIEANIRYSGFRTIIDRNLYFFSNLFGSGLKESADYSNIEATIQFNFNNFFVDPVHKNLIDEYVYLNKYGWKLSDKVKVVHII